ncbi:hypothetical protein CYMTET_6221 [Cymbomonas tetramitiformis]|uniref:Essential protein Yae1 N-terminal domain-containing protein n=1 Tax=Cymbomonas tetramitiformis TaxID=36881 RepID=A0AAE0GXK1_9CHLO|nr:hypothetical protein CYMTET_6221 [Cymbomonas tetramitiformis]
MNGLEDIFDSSLDLEEKHLDHGWDQGLRDGEALGLKEGWTLGLGKGFEIGAETGFYAGCVAVWAHFAQKDPSIFSERALKGIAALRRLISGFKEMDTEDDELQDQLEKLRAKFKAVTAMLGVRHEYQPTENASALQF